jgi:hypothetical protein
MPEIKGIYMIAPNLNPKDFATFDRREQIAALDIVAAHLFGTRSDEVKTNLLNQLGEMLFSVEVEMAIKLVAIAKIGGWIGSGRLSEQSEKHCRSILAQWDEVPF